MYRPKILFSDMDGTLLRNNSTVSEPMKRALDRLTGKGHKLVLTSGRPLDSILEVMDDAGLYYPSTLVIAYNGGLVYDCDARASLLEKRLPMDKAAGIVQIADEMGLHIQSYTEHEVVCRREDEEVTFYRRRTHLPLITAPDILALLDRPPYKLHSIHLTDHSRLCALKERVEAVYGDSVSALFSNRQYLEFYRRDSGKGNAITWVCDYFHIPICDSIAAGDAENDLSMLKAAGVGVAMQNADQNIKNTACFITQQDNEHDGLIEAIDTLILAGN